MCFLFFNPLTSRTSVCYDVITEREHLITTSRTGESPSGSTQTSACVCVCVLIEVQPGGKTHTCIYTVLFPHMLILDVLDCCYCNTVA